MRRVRRFRPSAPVFVLAVGLLLSLTVSSHVGRRIEASNEARFRRETEELRKEVEHLFDECVALAEAHRSLFAASHTVEAEEWEAFTRGLDRSRRFHGIEGTGFVHRSFGPPAAPTAVSCRGAPYGRRPGAAGAERFRLVFVAPSDERTRTAVGYDPSAEPARRAAMEAARDRGEPAMTGRVRLRTQDQAAPTGGFVLFLPVYLNGAEATTVADRRENLIGYVTAAFLVDDLLAPARARATANGLDLDLLDGPPAAAVEGGWERRLSIVAAGRTWGVVVRTRPDFVPLADRFLPGLLLAAGGAATLSAALLARILAAGRDEARARYRALFEHCPDAIVVANETDEILDVNPAATRLSGYARAEHAGLRIQDFQPPDRRAPAGTIVRTDVERGCPVHEGVLVRKDGTRVPIEITPARLSRPGARPVVGFAVIRDLSERKRAEEALRARTEQLEAVSDAMTGFLETGDWRSASGRILSAALRQTASAYGFVGVVAEDGALRVLAHEGFVWSAEANREMYEAALRSYRERGYIEFKGVENLFGRVVRTGEVVVSNDPAGDPRAGGTPAGHPPLDSFLGVPIACGGTTVGMIGVANRPGGYGGDETGQIEVLARAAGVLYDLYRRREREAALERQVRRGQRLEAIGLLAAGVAHEINNPLTYVLQNLEELIDLHLSEGAPAEPGAVDEARARAREAREGAERIRTIVRGLKTFSHDAEPEAGSADVARAVEGAVKIAANEIRFRARLVRDVAPLPPVRGDEGRLTQVLLNLLVNAAHAIPPGDVERHEIRVRAGREGDEAVVEVRDTGRGMPPEVLERVFDPFFTTKSVGEGTGLGLSICHNTIRSFGGRIDVESEVGRGTTFAVRLPLAERPDVRAPERSESAPVVAPARRGRILVVDDEAGIRAAVARALGRAHDVVQAVDGREALEILDRDDGFDVVLCDLMMTGLDGMRFHVALEARRPDLAARTIFMTGGAFTPEARAFVEKTTRPQIEKPFTARAVRCAVCRALSGEDPGEGREAA